MINLGPPLAAFALIGAGRLFMRLMRWIDKRWKP